MSPELTLLSTSIIYMYLTSNLSLSLSFLSFFSSSASSPTIMSDNVSIIRGTYKLLIKFSLLLGQAA